MNYNCPVCNKPGLPDYRTHETTCPQCNSDLKPYLILNSIKKRETRYVSAILAIAVALSFLIVLLHFKSVNKNERLNNEIHSKLGIANDSITTLNRILNQYEVNQVADSSPEKGIAFIYRVRSGDNLGKIAELFFDDYHMFKKIAEDNNLAHPFLLTIGQPLTINLPQ